MSSEQLNLRIEIESTEQGDPAIIDQLAHRLIEDFGQLDGVWPNKERAGELPAGALGLEPEMLGVILLTVLPTVLPKLVDVILSIRGRNNTITLKVQIKDKNVEVSVPLSLSSKEIQKKLEPIVQILGGESRKNPHQH